MDWDVHRGYDLDFDPWPDGLRESPKHKTQRDLEFAPRLLGCGFSLGDLPKKECMLVFVQGQPTRGTNSRKPDLAELPHSRRLLLHFGAVLVNKQLGKGREGGCHSF